MKYLYNVPKLTFLAIIIIACCSGIAPPVKAEQHIVQLLSEAVKSNDNLTFCGEPVPLKEDDIKERLERELLIALDSNDDIILWLKRANRYFPHIEKVLKDNNMPDDLKFIAIAESALKPHAASNKGAVGYWQFIEATGLKYGMEINSDIDERRNLFTSTEAAVSYLKDLYAIFGSWTLAAAAYNMGEEGLKAEILVQKENNFYKLFLYQETQRYIFRILAAKIIMSQPEKYGYDLAHEDLYHPVTFDMVEISVKEPAPIYIIAQAAKTNFKTIKELNSHIKSYYLPAGKHKLLVPKGTAMDFTGRYESILSQWFDEKKDRIYIVKKGDNLSTIATRFNVPVKAIMIWNDINNGKKIAPGDKLFIFSSNFKQVNIDDAGIPDQLPASP